MAIGDMVPLRVKDVDRGGVVQRARHGVKEWMPGEIQPGGDPVFVRRQFPAGCGRALISFLSRSCAMWGMRTTCQAQTNIHEDAFAFLLPCTLPASEWSVSGKWTRSPISFSTSPLQG